jgi:hypothetical protein
VRKKVKSRPDIHFTAETSACSVCPHVTDGATVAARYCRHANTAAERPLSRIKAAEPLLPERALTMGNSQEFMLAMAICGNKSSEALHRTLHFYVIYTPLFPP